MKRTLLAAAAALVISSIFPTLASAQGAPQTLTSLNVATVATGFRASKIVGAAVINENNEKIGNIDDLIITRSDRVPYAIVSVGGFLGIGEKLVAVPIATLDFRADRTVMAGASKDMLKALPEFKYAK